MKKLQQICSWDLKNENKKIWIFKSEILFIIIFVALKSAIKKTIWNDIDEDAYNDVELWIALENRYKTHAVNILAVTCSKLCHMQIKNFSSDISHYISSFNHYVEKLKIIDHQLFDWFLIQLFIDDLNDHQTNYIHIWKNELCDTINWICIQHFQLNDLQNKLLVWVKNLNWKWNNNNLNFDNLKDQKSDSKADDSKKNELKNNSKFSNLSENKKDEKSSDEKKDDWSCCNWCDSWAHLIAICWFKDFSKITSE